MNPQLKTATHRIDKALKDLAQVKRWIDNDIEAGDTEIRCHSDRLADATDQLVSARELITPA